jgi:hypothetical protein
LGEELRWLQVFVRVFHGWALWYWDGMSTCLVEGFVDVAVEKVFGGKFGRGEAGGFLQDFVYWFVDMVAAFASAASVYPFEPFVPFGLLGSLAAPESLRFASPSSVQFVIYLAPHYSSS